MRVLIERNLSSRIDGAVVRALVRSYELVVANYRKLDLDACLNQAGKFVEHTLRAVEHLRTGVAPPEIKSVAATVREIEKDKSLPESLRLLVPRIAQAMVYEVRSKRGAVHVKEIDPRTIDAALCVQAASWATAELLRLYHVDTEAEIMEAMAELMRGHIPLVEAFGDEIVVTAGVPCLLEMLLLIARSTPAGLDRRALGASSKYPPSTVTRSLQSLEGDRHVHKTRDGRYHITGPGKSLLTRRLAELGLWTGVAA